MKNKAIIFDLDDTILSTKSIPASTFQPVFDAIAQSNNGLLSRDKMEMAFEDLWRRPFDVVAEEYGFSDDMVHSGKDVLISTDYKLVLSPFDDYHFLRKIQCKKFLVTTGITRLQQAKIDALFNSSDFNEIIIDDPYLDFRLGKQKIFSDIAKRHLFSAEQVWVVGDNSESEIKAGNALGMNTVQIIRPGVCQTNIARYTISSFGELENLIIG